MPAPAFLGPCRAVIALVASSRAQGARGGTNPLLSLLKLCLALLLVAFATGTAAAQVAASVGIDSDYRLRGYSLSGGDPALSAQVSYDDPSGLYFGLSALTKLGGNTRFLGVIGNAGYSKRIGKRLTIDTGLLRSQIRGAVPGALGFNYTEVYAGAYVGPVTARLYYSPDYRTAGQSTLYGEVEAGFEPISKWRVSGHVGVLKYLKSNTNYRVGDTLGDWRISVAREFGKFEAHMSLSRNNPNNLYAYRSHPSVAVTAGASLSF